MGTDKAKDHRSFWRAGGGGPEGTPALRLRLPGLLLPYLLPPLLLLCGCFSDWGKGLSLRPASETSPIPPLTCKEGWGLKGPGVPGLCLLTETAARRVRHRTRFCSNPEIKGLRTMTSTLLSPWFPFSLL